MVNCKYIVGKKYYFYDERASDDVCLAHILHVMPHPEWESEFLIVYRWYGKHKKHWWYGITDTHFQQRARDLIADSLLRRKENRLKKRLDPKGKNIGLYNRVLPVR